MSLITSLKWRYAVKKFSNKKVNNVDLQTILDAINLSASSAGLQPYRVIVVENEEIRAQLGKGEFNPQITEASHLLVFAAKEELSTSDIDEYMQRMADTRGLPIESLSGFREILTAHITGRSKEENFVWATKQAYIGLGTGLAVAAELRIDTTPMEGFNPAKFDEILELKKKGLKSVVLLAVGYRDTEKDPYVNAAKVRLDVEDFTIFVK
ncbi:MULTISPECIES: NAD(P)H-dependent oxidoreductase [unclassified Chitinophaga]|uniref:NAD(P)H-dependent oxidoreductase n=1 Tax=unclassified Chitinophaga TaxID=2619133 RepID=UPI0009CFC274|nr:MULTISPECIES: NAD(P)H-dependent oxidoreductase [unclassified Chitinophaga]OMP76570.1 NAD(P)H-dependent oxidoreductase [[Flexibacter] sp. ATCC 35208]WPV66943.1 NAD(P)H-dependent oxidoreductase [Chitinophaga sp. LS1]